MRIFESKEIYIFIYRPIFILIISCFRAFYNIDISIFIIFKQAVLLITSIYLTSIMNFLNGIYRDV